MPQSNILSGRALLALFLAFALVWMGTLGYRKLIGPDEGRYAEISREMALAGDWVTPRLNGIKYFEKPPLQYWATAATYKAIGESEFAARFWTGLTGLFSVLLAWVAGRRLFGEAAGLLAAAVAGSSLLFNFMGHINTLDMGLAAFLHLALTGFLLAQGEGPMTRSQRRWMMAAWAGLALAVLSKGLVALVLTGATLVLYSLVTRDFSPWRRLLPLPGIALFLAIAAPWFVAASAANPEFARFFFIHEHFERFLTKTHGRYEPPWYFGPVLAVGLLPWTAMALQALPTSWRRQAGQAFQPRRFLLLWCVVVFGFFSASGSKLPSYILPMFAAIALLLGDGLGRLGRRALAAHIGGIAAVAAIGLMLAPKVAGQGDPGSPPEMMAAYSTWLVGSAAIWLIASLAALWLALKDHRLAAPLVLAGGTLLAGQGALLGHDSLSGATSGWQAARFLKPRIEAGAPLYSLQMYDQTLPFYLGRTVTLVNYRDEMDFGLRQEPNKAIAAIADLAPRWNNGPEAYAIMRPQDQSFLSGQLQMTVVYRDPRRIVVRNRQEP